MALINFATVDEVVEDFNTLSFDTKITLIASVFLEI
jgi:hypothetical protein